MYKQGQAGVTKATVSIVFNNSDKANGPVEYQHLDQITVTRQVRHLALPSAASNRSLLTKSQVLSQRAYILAEHCPVNKAGKPTTGVTQ